MTKEEKKMREDVGLDNRLGTPMKKVEGLSSDMKKAESEHLHAFRKDVNLEEEDEENNGEDKKESEE